MSHTPGPYFIVPASCGGAECFISANVDGKQCTIAHLNHSYGGPISLDQFRANQHLITAAPDLLEACKKALNQLEMGETGQPTEEILIAAIAKAGGAT